MAADKKPKVTINVDQQTHIKLKRATLGTRQTIGEVVKELADRFLKDLRTEASR